MTPNTAIKDNAARDKADAVRIAEANAPRPRLADYERPPSVFIKEQPSRDAYTTRAWIKKADGDRKLEAVRVYPAALLGVLFEQRLTRTVYCSAPGDRRELRLKNATVIRWSYDDLAEDECLIERPEYDPDARAGSVLGLSYIVGKWVPAGTAEALRQKAERRSNPAPRPAVTMAGNLAALVARYNLTLTPSGGVLARTVRTLRPDEAATLTVLEPLLAAHLGGQNLRCDFCEAEAVGIALVNVAVCAEHANG